MSGTVEHNYDSSVKGEAIGIAMALDKDVKAVMLCSLVRNGDTGDYSYTANMLGDFTKIKGEAVYAFSEQVYKLVDAVVSTKDEYTDISETLEGLNLESGGVQRAKLWVSILKRYLEKEGIRDGDDLED